MRCVASYTYADLSGTSRYQVQRLEDDDGRKSFRQSRADGSGGWVDGKGTMDGVERVLYRWPDLRGHRRMYVAEGEKCADELWTEGIPATTNAGGAGKWNAGPFHEGHSNAEQLKLVGVENVVVLPDNDDPGRRHADDVATACHAVGLCVKVIELPNLPPKGDVVDYLGDHSKDDLFALVTAAPEWTPAEAPVTPATGVTLLEDVVAFIRRYVALSDHQATELALFVVHTHAFAAAETTPYQNIGSATKQSGKTRLLEVLELLVTNPWLTGRATTAVLARRIEQERPTLLLDETDAAFKAESDYAEALRAILNSGIATRGKRASAWRADRATWTSRHSVRRRSLASASSPTPSRTGPCRSGCSAEAPPSRSRDYAPVRQSKRPNRSAWRWRLGRPPMWTRCAQHGRRFPHP